MKYDVIIGLEIHAELKTKSKMFCSCNNESEGKPANTAVCPICLGHPGTLPVPNKQAIDWTLLLGISLSCKINKLSKFDRKNYFYPDLPKGYQVSQYDQPFCFGGKLNVDGINVKITRIHLEEDTGKLIHNSNGGTLVDFNRAGTPLVEMVTDPVIKTAVNARRFCQRYQQVLRYLDISNADMEKGEMRCEANVSVQKKGIWEYRDGEIKETDGTALNAKVEIKNINSFRAVEKAINFEIERQKKVLDSGEKIFPETRGWNENSGETVVQRIKESSADYRYFPEPDIPPIQIDKKWIDLLKLQIVELPSEKKKRFHMEYDLSDESAEILVSDKHLADYAENVISELRAWTLANGGDWELQSAKLAKLASNWLINELFAHLRSDKLTIRDIAITPENFAELISLIFEGKINSSAGQEILKIMYQKGGDPTHIMDELGLKQMDNDIELEDAIKKVIDENPEQASEFRAGKEALLQFFVGKTMTATSGKANPKSVISFLKKLLK